MFLLVLISECVTFALSLMRIRKKIRKLIIYGNNGSPTRGSTTLSRPWCWFCPGVSSKFNVTYWFGFFYSNILFQLKPSMYYFAFIGVVSTHLTYLLMVLLAVFSSPLLSLVIRSGYFYTLGFLLVLK